MTLPDASSAHDPDAAGEAHERRVLRDGAATLGVPLDDASLDRLLRFRDLLARWNAVHNLTAVREPAAMLVQHLLDCLAVIAPLRRERAGRPATRLLDVGSGGGLPGVVIAIVCPEVEVVCVDAVAKKANFVRQVAAELRLGTLHAVHGRVEALDIGRFDVVTARAFASLAELTALTRRHLAEGGVWMAMKGRRPESELAALPADVTVFHVEPLAVPGLGAERCLVWIRPAGASAERPE